MSQTSSTCLSRITLEPSPPCFLPQDAEQNGAYPKSLHPVALRTEGYQQAERISCLALALCTKGHTGETLHTTVSLGPGDPPAPCPWGPELVPALLLVAQRSCTLPCGFPTLTHSSQIIPSDCATCFLQGTLADTLKNRRDTGVPMGTGGTPGEPSLPIMAVSRKGRQRTAIITWRQRWSVLAIPFFRILPDLETLNGHTMLPGNENREKQYLGWRSET